MAVIVSLVLAFRKPPKPKLTLRLDERKPSSNQMSNDHTYELIVENLNRSSVATGVDVAVISIKIQESPDSQPREDEDHYILKWANENVDNSAFRRIGRVERCKFFSFSFYNVLKIVALYPPSPVQGTNFVIKVQARSDETESPIYVATIGWDGVFDVDWTKMRDHVSVKFEKET